MVRCLAVWLILVGAAAGQDEGLTARDLYLKRIAPTSGLKQQLPAAVHFGIRYNLLQIDRKSNVSNEVDPDGNFHAGDCLAIRLVTNRSGRLFVFNRGAAGKWQPLLPSPDTPNEPNSVVAGLTILVPAEGCFEIDKTLGSEVLMLVVTEKDADHGKLNEELKRAVGGSANSYSENAGGSELGSRELSYQKIKTPQISNEPPYSVYVASTPNSANDHVSVAIKIRHE